MLTSLKLDLQCNDCGKPLVDEAHIIDGEPSIMVDVEIDGRRGVLRLSAIYGSYAAEIDIPAPDGGLATLSCPFCGVTFPTQFSCDVCGAPLISMHLVGGGRINFCSRKGCQRHFLEFNNDVRAMVMLHDLYALGSQTPPAGAARSGEAACAEARAKEILRSGTFLRSYCPHCDCSLIRDNAIAVGMISPDGGAGTLLLSPFLNVFTHASTIALPEGREIADLECPHCRRSLIERDDRCADCGSHVARITVSAMSKLISFFICMRIGCHWHGVSEEDTRLIALEDSLEW